MNNEQDLQQIRISLTAAKEKVSLLKALGRLRKNADFKKVFLDGFADKYVRRVITLKTLIHMQGDKDQKYMEGQINAVGFFEHYMILLEQEGIQATNSIVADEEEQELILNEETDNA